MAAGNKTQSAAKKVTATEHPLLPSDAQYRSLSPHKIRANPENPRMFFHNDTIEQLAESIEKEGVLVPITVYEDKQGSSTHVLLDGERRWRAAKLINLPEVPAWVIPKPTGTENMVRMFNIHMLREEWDELPIAWAIEKLMSETGVDGVEELHELTGLSRDRLRNIKILLAFPREKQKLVAEGRLSFNYLIELQKNVLNKLAKVDDDLLGKKEKVVRDAFIKKYLNDVDTDPIALRQVGKLIDTARLDGNVGARARGALRKLVDEPTMTVDEAYELGAAASVELRRVLRDMEQLPERLAVVANSKLDASETKVFAAALRRLHKAVTSIMGG
ncbi:MAG: ParB/RepB/Spo0J family partition protein [Burkholderiaceae bacterium]|nr:ParB/RepB/Spo0J family partition protein [Burkholderiaceae bacterium]